MKKIYMVDIWRRIKRTIVTYFSIMLIICLGISSYLGIRFAKVSMEETGDYNLSKQKFRNIEVKYGLGIDEDDLNSIKEVEGVTDVEGVYITSSFLELEEEKRLVSIRSVTEKVDIANVIEGRLPSSENEIAIEKVMADEDNIQIGSEVVIDSENNSLNGTKYKVVGVVEHPAYSCNYVYGRRGISEKGNGNNLNFFLVSEEAFNKDVTMNLYNSAVIWSDELGEHNTFTDKYKEESKKLEDRLFELSKERAKIKREKLVTDLGLNESDLPEVEWVILNRDGNVSYSLYASNAEGLGKLSFSFAFVYIVVAMMVCYSSIGRMITKQKLLIGTQKALGYKAGEIKFQYIAYSWTCAFWGCLFGILWAVWFVQTISLRSYKPIYYFQDYTRVFEPKITIVVVIFTFALTLISTLFACNKVISRNTVSLLKDEVFKNGKKYFFESSSLWKKLSLFKRTVFKNIIYEKKHLLTTVLGVGGCTALMIIGFTLKFAMDDVKNVQFDYIQKFDVTLQVEKGSDSKPFSDELDKFEKIEYLQLMNKMVGIRLNNKDTIVADLLSANTNSINDYFAIEEESTGEEIEIEDYGVVISSNTADYYDIKVNDEIEIMLDNGEYVSVPVNKIAQNYVSHFVVMSNSYYKEVTNIDPYDNIFFIKLNGEDKQDISKAVNKNDGYIAISGKEMGISIFDNISDSLNAVIQVMITLSAIMALIVVLNLIVMYINEKKKALSIMRINGYTIKEVKSFITYSNVVYNFLGLVLGNILGVLLGGEILKIIENDTVAYIDTPNLLACFISSSISIGYLLIIGYLACKKIDKLPLNNLNGLD